MHDLPRSDPKKVRDLLQRGVSSLNISIDEKTLSLLHLYFKELSKWSRRINLVGKAPDRDIIENHFLDSLTVLPYLDPCPTPGLVDVGSGAGFPGLPIKIVRPDLRVTLVEPRKKRASFLRHIIRTLKLSDVSVINHRLEEHTPELEAFHGKTPVLVSRAVTSIKPFLQMCQPFCFIKSRVICMKGPKAGQELTEYKDFSHANGDAFALSSKHSVHLPFTGISRNLIIFTCRRT